MTVVRLMPSPSDGIRGGLESVIAGALAGGAPEPTWVAFDDGSARWVAMAAERPAVERAGAVVAAATEESLVAAQKLGIGGAMWMPPAYLGALDAFEAAGSMPRPVRDFDPVVVELLEPGTPIQVVTVSELGFWRVQLGDRVLVDLLAGLASALEAPAAILPWPALVAPVETSAEIDEAWSALVSDLLVGRPALSVASLAAEPGERGGLEAVYRCLVTGIPAAIDADEPRLEPVHELPSGHLVGWWSHGENPRSIAEGSWCATPVRVEGSRCLWGGRGSGESFRIEEVLTVNDVEGAGEAAALRIPGWAAQNLRPGSPAGLLARRLADAASNLGVPLWIPNVDREALTEVLRLPGTIWVDGPAVPR